MAGLVAAMGLGLAGMGTGVARGDIVVTIDSIMQLPDPHFRVTFGASVINVQNVPAQEISNGDFFTVYDVPTLIVGTNRQPDNWAASFNRTGTTPAGVNPPDDPITYNVTWTFVGDNPIPASQALGAFSVETTSANFAGLYYAGQDTIIGDGKHANVGFAMTPTPEPSSGVLAGLGLATAWSIRRARRRRVAA